MIELDADQKTPLYEQLYAALADEIRTGQRAPGTPLPGRRTMAAQQGVSVNTVDAAYQMLAAEGLAEPRPRSGCYVQKTYGMLHSRARRAAAGLRPVDRQRGHGAVPGAQLGTHPEGAALPAARAFTARRDAGRRPAAHTDRGIFVGVPRCGMHAGADRRRRGH